MRTILLIDGSSLAFRAFYSILELDKFTNRSGLHTNALFSFNLMLNQVLTQFEPSHILVAFDKSDITFRTEKYQAYKGGRQKTPEEFKEQMPYFSVLLDGYGISHYQIQNYEADDIIGTLAHQAKADDRIIVLSGDKDLIQLASANTTVYITRKGVSTLVPYTVASIKEDLGITPEQIIDMKGLMGDSSDNYPGVAKVGEKTALKLLHEFETLENLYAHVNTLKPSKMKENLIKDRDLAFMSKDLARILTDAPIEISLDDIEWKGKDREALLKFYRQMDFNAFLKDLQAESSEEKNDDKKPLAEVFPDFHCQWVDSIEPDFLPEKAVLYWETLEENYHIADVVGIAWADIDRKVLYQVDVDTALTDTTFRNWLKDPTKGKILFDSKKGRVLSHRFAEGLDGVIFDILLATYLIDTHNAQEMADILQMLGMPEWVQYDEAVYGKGVKRAVPDAETLHDHLSRKVIAMAVVLPKLEAKMKEVAMYDLYHQIELPLARVLALMEIEGIKVDRTILDKKNEELLERLKAMEAEIYQAAGETFNIASPKKLGEILFDKLGLPVIKKTKTGYSTAVDVLEKLQNAHPIIPMIMDYRQIAKLQSTYLASLPEYIQADGKIHTRFVQTLTQTGRLSSTDPNLQNIPIRIEEGKQVRQAFVPSHKGWQFFGADYSQIELRVLAHMSEDPHLRQAFIEDQDIHDATARRVFNITEDKPVDSNTRRNAKAVNFGIVYGISDYGLSNNLNINRKEAKQIIDTYFEKFPGVRQYMHAIVEKAKEDGYVSTLFHRRRYLRDIHAKNFNIRSFAERTAMNSPIQGTAADIIKIAMVELQTALEKQNLKSKLLLTVHDELILEGPAEEMPHLSELVPEIMEHAVELSIPLKVDFDQGNTWYDI